MTVELDLGVDVQASVLLRERQPVVADRIAVAKHLEVDAPGIGHGGAGGRRQQDQPAEQ